jgi:uncharacterized lipoprotein YddW (UPF0748 family)
LLRFLGFFFLLAGIFHQLLFAQTDVSGVKIPRREVRAVWIATVAGLDWPTSTNLEIQKKTLLEMLEKLKAAHFNTIFFQVRGRADAMYRSHHEPWAQQLTDTLGKDPHWDPLDFIIKEAHERGMEVHAWFNTFLVKSGKSKPSESIPRHVILEHPEWLHLVDGEWWLDPGLPAVREYLNSVAMDIVYNYDIDGIHFDFIRYPGKRFPDEEAYARYGNNKNRDEWRRENINKFVRVFYNSAISVKPMLKIGSAPIGIYTNVGNSNGWQSYYDLFQDSRSWLRDRVHDYLAPQVYWVLGDRPGNPDFAVLAKDWSSNSFGRQIYLGVGAYKPEVHQQLSSLIDTSRHFGAIGNAFFRYSNITNALEMGGRYRYPANIPPMRWKDSIPPNPPENLNVVNVTDGIFKLQWLKPIRALDGDTAKYFDVYRSARKPVDVNNPSNLIAITATASTEYLDTIAHPTVARYFYAVTALDKGNNESAPTIEKGVMIREIAEMAKQFSYEFRLGKNYPSPASHFVFIPYEVKKPSPVVLKILDQSNKELIDVVDAVQEPGRYIAAADISKLKDGIYSYLLIAGDFTDKKIFRVDN